MTATRALLIALLVCLGAAPALSRNGFEAAAYKVLQLQRIPSSALAKAQCQICHVNPQGGPPWNPFGLAVGSWRAKKQTIQDAIYSAMRYGGDTDHDGYPDLLEQLAGSNPSDRDSKPTEKLEELKARFDANFRLQADADGDGYPDALEAFAGSLPGDPASHPSETREKLEAAFAAAGGLDLFKPSH